MKLIILIGIGVLSSLVVCVLSVEHAERNEFEEDELQLEADDAFRLLIDNDVDEAELRSVMLANWFTKAGNSLRRWGKKAKKWTKNAEHDTAKWTTNAVHDTKKWTKNAVHDTKKWTKNAVDDTKKWTKNAVDDTKKWTKNAVKDVDDAVQKGCHVVNLIPVKELVSEMNQELRAHGVSEDSVDEEQLAAAYEGIKDICKVIG